MKKFFFFIVMSLFNTSSLFSQVSINAAGSAPDASAVLDINNTNKGFLPPRMSQAQIAAIPSPVNGLVVFCNTDNKFYAFITSINTWQEILFGSGLIAPPFTCGSLISVNHVAGAVAPVNKLVTYGTVTNIPGETSKCWITSNLGADHQATAINDITEASAGWYWQFNLMQGYKHDGTTVTPAWTITSINENSNWLAANDPCTIELGSGWRIPTHTEWTNVVVSGGWADWNGPWNSALKIHGAGRLSDMDGSLVNRVASYGYYWSSSQDNNSGSWFLHFYSGYCAMPSGGTKALGFSVRCLKGN